MMKKKKHLNGVYIQHANGKLYTHAEWNTTWNAEANGVAVISDNCEFVISPSDIEPEFYWDYYNVPIPNIATTTDESTAKKDYAGSFNTDEITRVLAGHVSAAGYCKAYVFKHGKTGYLGSLGEWQKVLDNKSEIIACMSLMGGEINAAVYYWTSTQYSKYDAWTMRLNNARVTQWEKKTILSIRAFAALDPF